MFYGINMILKKKKAKKSGSILVFTLIVMSLILVTALALSTTTIIERKASTITRSSAAAIQGADSGLEHILKEFRDEYAAEEKYEDFIANIGTFTNASDQYCDDSTLGDSGDYIIKTTDPEQLVRIAARRIDPSDPDHTILVRCDDSAYDLQDIVAFKSTGEDRIATRALRIDMGKSIDRGLFAFWDFEDYENAYAQTHEENNIQLAVDMSKKGNAAYLCPDDEQSSSVCSGSGGDMNPGPDDNMVNYNDGISWFGDRDFDDTPSASISGIADHDLDVNNHWAMSFNVDENNDASPSTPNEYLLVKDDALTPLDNGNFSISLWIQPKIDTGKQFLIGKGITSTNAKKFHLYLDSTTPHFFIRSSNSAFVDLAFGSISKNDWYHLVVTFEKNNSGKEVITGYIDGHLESFDDTKNIASINNTKPLILGADNDRGNNFIGQMDDVRLYNRVLSQDEVTELCIQGEGFTLPTCT